MYCQVWISHERCQNGAILPEHLHNATINLHVSSASSDAATEVHLETCCHGYDFFTEEKGHVKVKWMKYNLFLNILNSLYSYLMKLFTSVTYKISSDYYLNRNNTAKATAIAWCHWCKEYYITQRIKTLICIFTGLI